MRCTVMTYLFGGLDTPMREALVEGARLLAPRPGRHPARARPADNSQARLILAFHPIDSKS